MAVPSAGTTTPVQWSIPWIQVAGLSVPSARLDVELFVRTSLPGRQIHGSSLRNSSSGIGERIASCSERSTSRS
jgi:hypothetical protein